MIEVQDNLFPEELLTRTFNYFESYNDWDESIVLKMKIYLL